MKSFIAKYAFKLFACIIAYFAPIAPLITAVFLFCSLDFITGIAAAKKQGIAIESKKMKNKVFELFFYILAILLSFVFYNNFKDFVDFPIHRVTAFIILSVEFWSNMENISKITNIPLLGKDKFIDYVNKWKQSTTNATATKEPNNDSK